MDLSTLKQTTLAIYNLNTSQIGNLRITLIATFLLKSIHVDRNGCSTFVLRGHLLMAEHLVSGLQPHVGNAAF